MTKMIEAGTESPAEKTLYEVVTEGVQKILSAAVEEEIQKFLTHHAGLKLPDERPRVVRNGYAKERELVLPTGKVKIRMPRVRDRDDSEEKKINFQSKLIPPYLRRATSLDEFIPFLYLKGVSTNDFSTVLSRLTGNEISLSATSVVRLKSVWENEFSAWRKRDLSGKRYVYFWADAIHLKVRLDDEKTCVLCIIAADSAGRKELIAVQEGHRESETSWRSLLMDLKARGLQVAPELATADGALGFWKALRTEYPETREQRCWLHKMRNVLDKMADSVQSEAKHLLHEIYLAPTRATALSAFDKFVTLYDAKYERAVQCLLKDKNESLTFYDFPAEHWQHLRSTNVIESMFATIRLRTYKTKGAGNTKSALTMLFKMSECAALRWRRLRGYNKIELVIARAKFVNGELEKAA